METKGFHVECHDSSPSSTHFLFLLCASVMKEVCARLFRCSLRWWTSLCLFSIFCDTLSFSNCKKISGVSNFFPLIYTMYRKEDLIEKGGKYYDEQGNEWIPSTQVLFFLSLYNSVLMVLGGQRNVSKQVMFQKKRESYIVLRWLL